MIDKLGLLQRFKAVAEHGSMRRAADALNLSQPALSRSIRLLEDDFRSALFTRGARGLVLTSFGESVLSVASRLARDWEISRAALLGSGAEYHGIMRISAGPLWAAVVLPVVVPRLLARFPKLALEVEQLSSQEIVDSLNSGRIDVCLGVRPTTGLQTAEFETAILTEIQDRVLARPDHPIHACEPHDLGAVHRFPWVIYSAIPSYQAETEYVLRELTGRRPEIRTTTRSLVFLLRLLQEGDFLCFLPDAFLRARSHDPLRAIPMDIGRAVTKSGATYRRSHIDFEPIKVLLDLCREFFAVTPPDQPAKDPADTEAAALSR